MQVGRLKKKYCNEEDVDGADILPSGVGKIMVEWDKIVAKKKNEAEQEAQRDEEGLPQEYVTFRVTALAENPIYVYGYVEELKSKQKRICHIPMQFVGRIFPNSKFKAQVAKKVNGKKFYRHEKCKR